MNLTCEDLGLTPEQLKQQLIDTMAERILEDDSKYASDVLNELKQLIKERIKANVIATFDEHVLPKVDELLHTLMIPHTNRYGEPKKDPQTLIEYCTSIAEHYMHEQVDSDGKAKRDQSYAWSAKSTRLMWATEKYLYMTLNKAVQKATEDVQGEFAKQVVEATRKAVNRITVTAQVKS